MGLQHFNQLGGEFSILGTMTIVGVVVGRAVILWMEQALALPDDPVHATDPLGAIARFDDHNEVLSSLRNVDTSRIIPENGFLTSLPL